MTFFDLEDALAVINFGLGTGIVAICHVDHVDEDIASSRAITMLCESLARSTPATIAKVVTAPLMLP